MKWFKHDSNAHRDAKLKRLIMAYGMEGYGLYWYCLEEIANQVSTEKFTFELEHDAEIIAFDSGMSVTKVEEIMKKMVDLNLFQSSNGMITCLKLAKRIDQSMTGNTQMRKIITSYKNQEVNAKNHDSVMTESRVGHVRVSPEEKRREEKRRDEKRKEEKKTPVGLNVDAWNGYLEFRKRTKLKKLTKASCQKQMKWLIEQGEFEVQAQIIDNSIRNGWQGLFPLKKQHFKTGTASDFKEWVEGT